MVGKNSGTIANSFSSGIVGGCFDNIGGLVGTNAGIIDSSYSTGGVLSARGTGGGGLRDLFEDLTGIYIGGSSRTCYTDGGGLVGQNYGTITTSHSASDVSGHSDNFGGLVGANRGGTITDSYATGPVSGNGYADVGGLVGDNNAGMITASHATGDVSGRGDFFGGLVGTSSGSITVSYATGRVSDGSGLLDANWDNGVISDSYWDTQTTGQVSSQGGIGKTTHELRSPMGYTGIYADWNVDLDGDGSADDPWDFGTASQYPVLKDHPPRSVNQTLVAPDIPSMTPGVGSITVAWAAPASAGGSTITAYDLRYIRSDAPDKADVNWTVAQDIWTTGSGALSHEVTGLAGGTQYDLQVRAISDAGEGPWSPAKTGAPVAQGLAATDFNGDGRTDFVDFFLFADAYGGSDPRFDLDGNGTVDFADFFRFVDAFGS